MAYSTYCSWKGPPLFYFILFSLSKFSSLIPTYSLQPHTDSNVYDICFCLNMYLWIRKGYFMHAKFYVMCCIIYVYECALIYTNGVSYSLSYLFLKHIFKKCIYLALCTFTSETWCYSMLAAKIEISVI